MKKYSKTPHVISLVLAISMVIIVIAFLANMNSIIPQFKSDSSSATSSLTSATTSASTSSTNSFGVGLGYALVVMVFLPLGLVFGLIIPGVLYFIIAILEIVSLAAAEPAKRRSIAGLVLSLICFGCVVFGAIFVGLVNNASNNPSAILVALIFIMLAIAAASAVVKIVQIKKTADHQKASKQAK